MYVSDDVSALIGADRERRRATEALIRQMLEALKAMRVVMDNGPKPEKLAAALTWRECDERARAMCDAAIAAAERRR